MVETRCQGCGRLAPTRSITLYQNVGLVAVRLSKTAKGPLCWPCIHRLFWEYTGITLVAGWWGMISFCVTPLFLLNNVGQYAYCLATNGPHKRRALEQLRATEEQEGALRARARAGDVAAGIELANLHLRAQRFVAARSDLEPLVLAHPEAAEPHHLLGIAKVLGDPPLDPVPHYERAIELAPEETRYRDTLANHFTRTGQPARAEPVLRELLARKPTHPPYLFQLARTLGALGRIDEAGNAMEQLLAVAPDARRDPEVQRTLVQLRRGQLPPPAPMDPAEMRRRARRANLQGLAILGGLALCALLVFAGIAASDHWVKVIVDNPTDRPARARFDGGGWLDVAPHDWKKVYLSRGPHVLDVADVGTEARFDVTVDPEHLKNVFGGALYLCDPLRAGVYCDYEVTYGTVTARHDAIYHTAEVWFAVAECDHLFQEAPRSVSIQKNSGGVIHAVLKRVTDVEPAQIAGYLFQHDRGHDAVRFLEAAIERSPGDRSLFDLLLVAARTDEHDEVMRWIEDRRTDDPKSVHFHRVYQDVARIEGNARGVEREYATRRAAKPDSPLANYLYGRVAPSGDSALEAFERAIELAPRFPWSHLGAAHELTVAGRVDEALPQYREFLELAPGIEGETSRDSYWAALFEARAWDGLAKDVRSTANRPVHFAREALEVEGQALVASDAPEPTWAAWCAVQRAEHADDPWFRGLAIDRLRWLGKRAEADRALSDLAAHGKADEVWAHVTHAGIALAGGDRETAERLLDDQLKVQHPGQHGVHVAVLLGISWEWDGDRARAQKWYDRAAELAVNWDDHELARFLLSRLSDRELVAGDRHRAPEARAISLLARAVRATDDGDRARLLERAERAGSWQLSEPCFLARSLAGKTRAR